jgi:aspartyl-tRNA(Asn)/glutamyl-tRNA(Gln) amidotransferase subunit A
LLDDGLLALRDAYNSRACTPVDVVHAMLARIERYDPFVRSYIHVDREGALRSAAELTAELEAGHSRGLLHGVVIGAKDSIPVRGMPCTYNSPLMRDWVPQRDAEAMRRLRAAGAIVVGKHNLNEFGWSLPSEEDLAPPPRNPWFPEERSVGSSSGGGAALAAGLAQVAIGTDGGGSIRLPAGQHLLFGVKPGHDDVPRHGVGDGSVSEVSVLARSAPDAAAVLAAMMIDIDAPDGRERLQREPIERALAVQRPPGRVRFGVPVKYLADVGVEPDVRAAFDALCDLCAGLGHEVVELQPDALAILHDAVRANFVLIAAEHHFDHEGPGGDRGRYGASAGFYNLPGAFLTAADYLHAQRVGGIARQAVDAVLGGVDILLMPTSPVTRTSTARNPKTHRRGGNAAFTAPFNLTGHPSISLPSGISREGIPIGMQLVGRRGSEFDQLRIGHALVSAMTLPAFPNLDAQPWVGEAG